MLLVCFVLVVTQFVWLALFWTMNRRLELHEEDLMNLRLEIDEIRKDIVKSEYYRTNHIIDL